MTHDASVWDNGLYAGKSRREQDIDLGNRHIGTREYQSCFHFKRLYFHLYILRNDPTIVKDIH